ncbi:MAG TPA: glycine zipper domain-containing protein [Polyangiaceae bacterium]|nr:glycine zipper domain-containing protein [Polyangiaceae bacterium]
MRTRDITPEEELKKLRTKGKLSHLGFEVAGAAGGAAIGAVAGAIAGPPGAVAGAVVGAAVGGVAGLSLERDEEEHSWREAELEAEVQRLDEQRRSSLPPEPVVRPVPGAPTTPYVAPPRRPER